MAGPKPGLDSRLSGLESYLLGLERRLSGLESYLLGLERRLSGLESYLLGLDSCHGDGVNDVYHCCAAT